MKKTELKSFDIATYDVEIEFNKKIAPIQKKIEKLDEQHETKSLKAHKDFLSREETSKNKIIEIDEKQILKHQRIEKAAENKLIKLRRKDQVIKQSFQDYKVAQHAANQIELDEVKARILELNDEQAADILVISTKYKQNVESYVEKLDTYNSNFQNNKVTFTEQYAKYSKILDESLEKIDNTKKESDELIQKLLSEFLNHKQEENNKILESQKEVDRLLSKEVINIRKNSNIKTTAANDYINELENSYEDNYKSHIQNLEDAVDNITKDFEDRKKLINKDLEMNLAKVDLEIEALGDKKPSKVVKSINNKRNLFHLRAKTIISYEEKIHDEKVSQLTSQIGKFKSNLETELLNLKKLAVFLVNDQDQLKDSGEYFKTLNIELKADLVKTELASNDYLIKHEKLKTEYLNNYTRLFNDIKKRLIDSNKSQIDQLTTINSELDDINKFLDTVEPLKEIELNKLRESIETGEIKERYKIKFAKQDHETKLINNNNKKLIALEEIQTKALLSANNKDITEIKNKEIHDKSVEDAKLKFDKASEIYRLRLNRTKLERNILESSYEAELEKTELNKELVAIQTQKSNVLLTKEIETHIENIKIESNYKKEVIHKRLEEDVMKLQENVSKLTYERDAFESSVNQLITEEERIVDKQVVEINNKMDEKLLLINEALQREIKEPSLNLARSEVIIKERMSKLKYADDAFVDYRDSVINISEDDTISVDQLKSILVKNKTVFEKVDKFIDTTYECLIDAVSFMNELEERSLLSQLSATADAAKSKKLSKQKSKFDSEKTKQIQTINASLTDHKTKLATIIKGNIQRLEKQKNVEFSALKEQVEVIYANIYSQLSQLATNIKKEVQQIYLPLTQKDQDILDNANKNAVKARDLVEKDREAFITPINQKYGEFIKEKEHEKHKRIDEYNKEIKEISSSIEQFNNEAKEKLDAIVIEDEKSVKLQEEQLQLITSNETQEIEKQITEIANHKMRLEQSYVTQLAQLDEKDEEAKKIFDYEERIYNIALETAQSRYNDSFVKTDKAHEQNISEGKINAGIINNNAEKNIERINKELLDATNEFEKNIFTTRPRFEESIGDAQRAIDDEQVVKIARKEELLELNLKRTEAIENGLYTSFKDAYEKLQANLVFYLEKYKIIEEEYRIAIENGNELIKNNFDAFKQSLYELGKNKITKTQKELIEINAQIS